MYLMHGAHRKGGRRETGGGRRGGTEDRGLHFCSCLSAAEKLIVAAQAAAAKQRVLNGRRRGRLPLFLQNPLLDNCCVRKGVGGWGRNSNRLRVPSGLHACACVMKRDCMQCCLCPHPPF